MQATPLTNNRIFIPKDFKLNTWEDLAPYYEQLLQKEINSAEELEQWLTNRSELDAYVSENLGWRYIKMNIDTTNADFRDDFSFFINEIEPKIAPIDHQLNNKLHSNSFFAILNQGDYKVYFRKLEQDIAIYREENIPLTTQLTQKAQQYGEIVGNMVVEVEGKTLTLQQAAVYLKKHDRNLRKEVYQKIAERRLKDKERLNDLFSEMIALRHQIALNAGFKNYRDYMFAALGRFDYNPEACFAFHEAIAKEVVPLVNEWDGQRKKQMQLEVLKPWDKNVDALGREALHPVKSEEELIDKTIRCFNNIHPFFGECMQTMKNMKHIDLESKQGKAPGGFNYPLYETGVPFIFMNSVGAANDVVTMLHEGGHAVHSFLTNSLKLTVFKDFPSEVAELASMSMELISMDFWGEFYPNKEALNRAKEEQLKSVLNKLPWIATIDKFQHLLYERPDHNHKEREQLWNLLMDKFSSDEVDWSENEEEKAHYWQKQLHLFEVPFYYIEYGMAQLGAIAVWKNYKENPQKAIQQYMDALKLGYTKSIPEIYQTAGIAFDFSQDYIKELVTFVQNELQKITAH